MPSGAVDIVLVEDNAHDAELALYALSKRKLPQNVEVLRDGAEALDYFFCTGRFSTRRFQDLPRLVLLDLKLPKVDGIEVLRRMKADRRLSSTPVVMLTSSREQRDVEESYRLGANSYVVKPVDFDRFAQALQSIGAYWLELNERARTTGGDEPGEAAR
jgi:two-component system, response regulator